MLKHIWGMNLRDQSGPVQSGPVVDVRPLVKIWCGSVVKLSSLVRPVVEMVACPRLLFSPNSACTEGVLTYLLIELGLNSRIHRSQVPKPRYLSPHCIGLYSRNPRSQIPKPR